MIMHKPKHLSHEEAAAIPENFLTGTSCPERTNERPGAGGESSRFEEGLTFVSVDCWSVVAYQALKLVGNLQEGQSVLVHAGAGTSISSVWTTVAVFLASRS